MPAKLGLVILQILTECIYGLMHPFGRVMKHVLDHDRNSPVLKTWLHD